MIEYCLPARLLKFSEPRRYVQLRVLPHEQLADAWILDPAALREWVDRDGRRTAIGAAERDALLERIVAAARETNLWLGLAGRPLAARPVSMPAGVPTRALPAPVVEDEGDCTDGEDIAIAAEQRRAARAAGGPPPDEGETETADPELQALNEFLENAERVPTAALVLDPRDRAALRAEIDALLTEFRPMADGGLGFADSIVRQLEWCRGALADENMPSAPGPFSMGDLAFRELNMHGDRPDLANRVIALQDAMLAAMR